MLCFCVSLHSIPSRGSNWLPRIAGRLAACRWIADAAAMPEDKAKPQANKRYAAGKGGLACPALGHSWRRNRCAACACAGAPAVGTPAPAVLGMCKPMQSIWFSGHMARGARMPCFLTGPHA